MCRFLLSQAGRGCCFGRDRRWTVSNINFSHYHEIGEGWPEETQTTIFHTHFMSLSARSLPCRHKHSSHLFCVGNWNVPETHNCPSKTSFTTAHFKRPPKSFFEENKTWNIHKTLGKVESVFPIYGPVFLHLTNTNYLSTLNPTLSPVLGGAPIHMVFWLK